MSTQDIFEKVLFHKSAIIKNVIAALLMVAILVFEGCFNFATMKWDGDILFEPAFWVRTFTKVFLMLGVKSICLLVFLDIARRVNRQLNKERILNEKLMKLKGHDFPVYIENVKNREIKIEAWKKKVRRDILKLERKAKPIDRALFFSEDITKIELKEKNHYCMKRKDLEYKLTDEYIEPNYHYLDITGYAQLDPAAFDSPIGIDVERKKYQITSKTKSAIALGLSGGIVILLITNTFWGASDLKKLDDYDALGIFISLLMDLIFMIWQAITGITKAFTIIQDQEVLPYCNRNRILNEYIYWREPDKIDNLKKWIEALEKESEKEVMGEKEEGA